MKRVNPIQVAASAAGAVLSALIASVFGVKGTVIGVAIGSIVATTAAAFVWDWMERTHRAVRQVVVKNADQMPFLRRGATTHTAGEITEASAVEASAVEASVDVGLAEPVVASRSDDPATRDAVAGEVPTSSAPTLEVRVPSAETGPMRLVASSRANRPPPGGRTTPTPEILAPPRRRARWTIALTVLVTFALALGIVTAVEVAAGRPLSSLIGAGHSPGGTSAGNLLTSTPPPATTTTTTTSPPTTTTVPQTTTTTSTSTTTSTTTTTTTTTPSASGATAPGTGATAGG